MLITIVTFSLDPPVAHNELIARFEKSAPRYREVAGLIRKHYVAAPDGGTAGGIYLWKTREHADRLYTDEFYKFIRNTYNCEPTVCYFESRVMVDNVAGSIDIEPDHA